MSVTLGDTSSELEKLKAQVKQAPQVVNSKTARNDESDIKPGDIWMGSVGSQFQVQIYTGPSYGWKPAAIVDNFPS